MHTPTLNKADHPVVACLLSRYLLGPTLLLIALLANAQGAPPSRADLQRQAQAVTITRDDWGIAHVHGRTDADAVFGMAYAQADQIDLAVKDFQHLLKIKPGDIDASNALGYTLADANRDVGVHLGEVLWKQGRQQDAQKVFDEVRKLDPHSTSLQNALKRLHP